MNKRQRKKYLKKNNKYIAPQEIWGLDCTICNFVAPRLRKLKETTHGYPGWGEMDTPEKWKAALEKMARAFEIHEKLVNLDDYYYADCQYNKGLAEKDGEYSKEGMQLFIEWFGHLWD